MSVVVRLFVAFALISSSLLSGCGDTPTALPTTAGTDAPISTPTPATPHAPAPPPEDTPLTPGQADPSPEADPGANTASPPALASLTVTPAGLGALRLGAPVPDQGEPTAMAIWDADYCKEFPHPQGGSTGAFHANYPHTVSPALGSSAPFTLATTHGEPDGTIASVIVFSPEVHTTVGLGVGASRSELTAAYLDFDEQWSGPLSDVYALNGEGGRLVFEVAKRPHAPLSDYWSEDVLETVLWMMVVPAGAPAPAIAASDAGGPCAI